LDARREKWFWFAVIYECGKGSGIMKNIKLLGSRTVLSVILILAPQIFAFALALDIYVPSIPAIRQEFAINQSIMQLTVSLFLLTTGLGQLIFGPISDQIGRRKVLLTSILFFIAGSVLCTVSYHIGLLIVARVVQALGACGMMVSAFAIVRDLFSGDDCAKIYSFLNSTIALSPLLAPLAGGYLAYWISWRASFALLIIIGLIIFISAKININETLAPENQRNLKKELFVDYFYILKNDCFLIYTFCASAGFAGFLVFFSSSSYIIINLLSIPKQHFGFYFAFIGIIFFIGSLISGYSAKHLGTYKTVMLGAALMVLSGLIMLFWYQDFGLSISAFMGPMMIMGIGGAFLMGGGAGGAISPFPAMAGTASALFGGIQFVFAFIVSQIVLHWQVKSTIPLGYTLAILGLIALAAGLASYKVLHGVKK
jgi:Bcr/CflA subfamily drug resistance transporter